MLTSRESSTAGRLVSATTEIVIIRADGTREPVGVVASWHRNPLRRLWWRLIDEPLARIRIEHANRRVRGADHP